MIKIIMLKNVTVVLFNFLMNCTTEDNTNAYFVQTFQRSNVCVKVLLSVTEDLILPENKSWIRKHC